MTLYVVTQGEYSAYHIIGIYSTKEQAEKIRKYYSSDIYEQAEIEEWELDKDIPNDINTVREYYRVNYYSKQYGEGTWEARWFTKTGEENIIDCPFVLRPGFPCNFRIDIPCDRVKDKNHAIKIAQDKFYELLATKNGV